MIFTRLILHNFGVFAGTNQIDFHHDKPIVLIGGMNGRGKTTLLEAIVLALYGRRSFLFREESSLSYSRYLSNFVNITDGSNTAFIQIDFINEEDNNSLYSIKRTWSSGKKITSEDVSITKNGYKDNFITDNWDSVIEGILPSEIAKFFFFDGEKIAQLASDAEDEHLKASVKTLLGLNAVDLLQKDLFRIVSKSLHHQTPSLQEAQFKENDQEIDNLEKELEKLTTEGKILDDQLDDLQASLQKKVDEFDKAGGRIAQNREFYLKEKSRFEAELSRTKADLLNYAADALPLLMVKTQLNQIRREARAETEIKDKKQAYQVMLEVFKSYSSKNRRPSKEIEKFFDFFEKQVNIQNQDHFLKVTSEGLKTLEELTDETLPDQKKEVDSLLKAQNDLEKQISIQNNFLSEETNQENLSELQKEIGNLNQLIGNKEQLRSKISSDLESLRKTIDRLQRDRLKNLGEAIRAQEKLEEQQRIQKYALLAIKVTEEYQVRLQSSKIQELEETMTSCYKKLANKKLFINKIKIDPVSLEFRYLSKDDNEISPDSLSAGEKQLMVISLLWALAITSKKQIPVVIDTPLARLDKKHRELIVENYYPYASKQVIILTTDTEITEDYYNSLKPLLTDEFILDYDNNRKSSSIRRGFFIGENSDSKTDTAVI